MDVSSPGYPRHWESDVVLNDGAIARVRPVNSTDAPRLLEFFDRVSDEALFYRFFGSQRGRVAAEVERLCAADQATTVALVMTLRHEIIGLVDYSAAGEAAASPAAAEVAFLVRDDQQSRGVASLLLEHLAEVGRERGVSRFEAEMLPQNRGMLAVFRESGYVLRPERVDGNIAVDFAIAATADTRRVMEQREMHADVAAIRALVAPRRVGLVGTDAMVRQVSGHLAELDFTGEVVIGATVAELPEALDLVIAEGDAEQGWTIARAAARAARGVLLLAPPAGPAPGPAESRSLVARARSLGVRVLGPSSLALVNTDPAVGLNASMVPAPRRGVVGMVTQSAGIGAIMMSQALSTGLGLSTFFCIGSYADVTANDVMHYWLEDEATRVCLISLDRIGNPRKFFRILRQLAARKPVIVFTPSRALRSARWDEAHQLPSAPENALDQAVEATGAIVMRRRDEMFDLAQVLARQPVPAGRRVRLVSNSPGLLDHAEQAASRWDLRAVSPVLVESGDVAAEIVAAVQRALADPETDMVLAGLVELGDSGRSERLRVALEEIASATWSTPLVAVIVDLTAAEAPRNGSDGPGRLPVFHSYADALQALARAADGKARRDAAPAAAEDRGTPDRGASARARRIIDDVLTASPEGAEATPAQTEALLASHGIGVERTITVATPEQAIAAGDQLGWEVVLKATDRSTRGRPESPNVHRDITDAAQMRRAWARLDDLASELGRQGANSIGPVVQPMAPPGVPLLLRAVEDRVLGPMVGVGIAGPTSDLLDDMAWRPAPLGVDDCFAMLSSLRSASLLEGYRGSPPADLYAVVRTLVNLSWLKDEFPEVVEVELEPALAGAAALHIVGSRVRVAPVASHRDPLVRRA